MRPVERGECHEKNNVAVVFSHYTHALPYLIERIGRYCSYCESRVEHALAVEHLLPKSKNPTHTLSWYNFLPACINCNSTKGKQEVPSEELFLPHQDNTFIAFLYRADGKVYPSYALISADDFLRAKNTIALVGLAAEETSKDTRQTRRKEAWMRALETLALISADPTDQRLWKPLETSTDRRLFSIWMAIFSESPTPAMKRMLEEKREELQMLNPKAPPVPENPWADTQLLKVLREKLLFLYPGTCLRC